MDGTSGFKSLQFVLDFSAESRLVFEKGSHEKLNTLSLGEVLRHQTDQVPLSPSERSVIEVSKFE